jgi:glycosyltransferase involved in cell wall biosynthesis
LKNAELVMIGGSIVDDRDVLRQYSGLFKHISFLHQEELARYYQDADIFVLPSLVDSFAMVVIEAMACGTPVIISENTGAKEIVRDGIDGFVVPVRDIDKLKEKILYFYENRDKVEEMGKNARAQVKQYTWERYRERIREAVMTVVYKTNNKEQ